ncbi:MAG: N-acetyltransferase [Chitinophagaceae bacterium]|nr:MAG: N-acetyltransferase [Chitinophagaceae bacterium]
MLASIHLSKLTDADFDNYYSLVKDILVMKMITNRALTLLEAQQKFQKILLSNQIQEGFGYFKIIEKNTNHFIGFCKLEILNKESTEAEIGYMLLPMFWGKGITHIVVQQLLDSVKTKKNIHKIFAVIDPQNIASQKILLKNKFVYKEKYLIDGQSGEVYELVN